jgi:hypothetical protein
MKIRNWWNDLNESRLFEPTRWRNEDVISGMGKTSCENIA